MSTESKKVDNLVTGIEAIAEANNIIKAKDASIKELETREAVLKDSIAALETNKANLERENSKIYGDNKDAEARKISQGKEAEENMKKLHDEIQAEREALKIEREEAEKVKAEAERAKSEAERIAEENKQAQAEVDSKVLETKRLSENRKQQIEDAKAEKEANETACRRLEILKGEVEKEKIEKENQAERIELANKEAQEIYDRVHDERVKAEAIKATAQQEQEAANFIKNEAYKVTMIMRQALHTFVQVNGTEVRVPEITDAHRLIIIRDFLAQCENPIEVSALFTPEQIKSAYEVLFLTPVEGTVEETKLVTEEKKVEVETDPNKEIENDPKTTEEEVTDFKKLPKAQLAVFAKENYGLDLNIDDNTHTQMVQAIVDEIEKKTQI